MYLYQQILTLLEVHYPDPRQEERMKKVLKWTGIVMGGLIILVVFAGIGLSIAGGARLNKTQDITAETIPIPTDPDSLVRGEHLVNVACRDCHAADLTGQPLIEDPAIGTIYAANITGLAVTHSDEEIVRAIRHAVDTDGRQLVIMPAEVFINFSEEDLGAVVAYLKTVPQSGDDLPKPELAFLGRILLGAGLFGDVFPAEYIDHNQPFAPMPEVGANIAYGEYLSRFCTACHGANLAGSQPSDPTSPPAPNLTPGGDLGGWTEADFLTTIHTGVTPNGRQLDPAFMPWQSFSKFDDQELIALWMYLQSLPPSETANQ
jgi:mono/diheme cytochrome c family protein